MIIKKILVFSLLCVLLTFSTYSARIDDVIVKDWIAVEPWEYEVCRGWGGVSDNQPSVATVVSGENTLSKLTATIQAQKSIIRYPDGTNKTYYEVAWYLQPFTNEEKYDVVMVGTNAPKTVYSGSAHPSTGDSNYHAEESLIKYTKARIKYETGSIEVPFVDK